MGHQITKVEGRHVTNINIGDGRAQVTSSDGEGFSLSTFLGGADSGSKALTRGGSSSQPVIASRAAAEADALFVPLMKYGAAGVALWYGVPMFFASLQAIGPLLAIGLALYFFFIRRGGGNA